MSTATRKENLQIHASDVTGQLMTQVKEVQHKRGLTDVDLANMSGLHRATIGRAKRDGDPHLSSFVALSAVLGLSLTFKGKDSEIESAPENIVHRGLSHFRTKGDPKYSDARREKKLADAWESANEERITEVPLMKDLVPGFTQDQATAAATVIQWLGTEVGFNFLNDVLNDAGYVIKEKK